MNASVEVDAGDPEFGIRRPLAVRTEQAFDAGHSQGVSPESPICRYRSSLRGGIHGVHRSVQDQRGTCPTDTENSR